MVCLIVCVGCGFDALRWCLWVCGWFLFLFMLFGEFNSVGLNCSLCCIGFVFDLYW